MNGLPATLTQLQGLLRAGALSTRESLALQRARFSQRQDRYGCVVKPLDACGSGGRSSTADAGAGPLDGIGLAHKDIFDLDGWAPGVGHDCGSPAPGRLAADVIARLERAGAADLGTLAMAEYACGATGFNPRLAPIRNPLGAQLAVGGSSSGSAVAVAGGLVYGALGTDTAGSVRIPAATCGVLGLKTTHGLLPRTGVHPLAPSFDGVGLLAGAAGDAQVLLSVLAEPGQLRPAVAAPRIKAWLPERLDAGVGAALDALARELEAPQLPTAWPEQGAWSSLAEIVLHCEVAATHRAGLEAGPMAPAVEALALPGLAMPPAWYRAALADRGRQATAFFDAHLREHDVLLLPALLQPVPDWASVNPGQPAFEPRRLVALYACMGFVNYLGFPSLVIPIAADAQGRPISAQFIGRPFEEQTLLALAARIERDRFGQDGFTPHFISHSS